MKKEAKKRYTVVIGAMKPMSGGHYSVVEQAVMDTMKPKNNKGKLSGTYVIVSGNDRTRSGEMPMFGDAALRVLVDFYLPYYAEKLIPQPQVLVAFGLLTLNPPLSKSVEKSISHPLT